MATITLHCPTCGRDVYIAEDDTPVCPVCSGPLLTEVDSNVIPDEESEQGQ
jgi:hypothetical protein